MKNAKNSDGTYWSRAIGVLVISIPAFWIVYQLLLRLLPRPGGGLSEFGGYLVSYIASLLSSAYFLWLAEGQIFDHSREFTGSLRNTASLQGGPLKAPFAISLLAVSWLITWFYVSLLKRTLGSSLVDGSLGFSLAQVEAARISANLNGLLSLGVTFPLLAATSFLAAWACSAPLRFKLMLLPACSFLFASALVNHGQEVLHTGRPPMLSVLQETGYLSDQAPTLGALGVFWFLYVAALALGAAGFAGYGRIWTYLGFKLRNVVSGRNQ